MKPIKGWKRKDKNALPDVRDPVETKKLADKFLKALGKGVTDQYGEATKYGKVKPTVARKTRPLPSAKKKAQESLDQNLANIDLTLDEDKVGGYPLHTVRKWSDGKSYQKTANGWVPVPAMKALPANAGPSSPASAKATKDSLPDDPWKYFNKTVDASLVDVSKLKTIRTRPSGLANAGEQLANAFNDGSKQEPVTVKANGDGTYTVVNGSNAVGVAQRQKWSKIPVQIQKGDEKPNKLLPPVMPEVGTWTDSVPGFPANTASHFMKDGRLDPEREKLHERIINAFLDQVDPVGPDEMPVAQVMMGGPASGKSSIAGGVSEGSFVRVDADEIKSQLPEYREGIKQRARNAAMMVHEESNMIVKKLRAAAMAQRKNILLDGTGRVASDYQQMIEKLRKEGYHVRLMMPDLDVETAIQRSSERGEKIGRIVPEQAIRDTYAVVPKNFVQLAKLCDEAALFDTRRRPPVLVWSKDEEGGEQDHEPEFMKNFRKANVSESMSESSKSPKKKKPAVSQKKMIERGLKRYVRDAEAMDKLPKKFKKGMGVIMPKPDDSGLKD